MSSKKTDKEKKIKVVVWDLDNTIWDGVLLEDPEVFLRSDIVRIIETLDSRGILQSISSKNDHDTAMRKLEDFKIAEYFLYPQIGWNAKSEGIKEIAESINVGIDTLAFIDDQPFELEEVAFAHEDVLCVNVSDISKFINTAEFTPRFITDDSKIRRQMYMSDIQRNKLEKDYKGPTDEFLATLGLKMTLSLATEDDLQRAEELTQRTHQLNTTGYTYNYDELKAFMESDEHDLIIATLEDKYGTYGKIGLCLVERSTEFWVLKLLLMSCRVMSRGVGTIMMNHIMREANREGFKLRAEFIRTDRNRMMFITYRLGNFNIIEENGNSYILEHDCREIQDVPSYVNLNVLKKEDCVAI